MYENLEYENKLIFLFLIFLNSFLKSATIYWALPLKCYKIFIYFYECLIMRFTTIVYKRICIIFLFSYLQLCASSKNPLYMTTRRSSHQMNTMRFAIIIISIFFFCRCWFAMKAKLKKEHSRNCKIKKKKKKYKRFA